MTEGRILLADDHPAVLEGLRRTLEPELQVVGSVQDGKSAIEKAEELTPDVVVLDIYMPGLNGFQVAEILRMAANPPFIIFVSAHEDMDLVRKAFAVGGSGYVFKRRVASDLRQAIKEVRAGGNFVSPSNC